MIPAIYKKWIWYCLFFFLSLCLNAQGIHDLKFRRSKCYAGIEIGSKGVKWTILAIGAGGKESGAFQILRDSSVNTDFINFDPGSFHASLEASLNFYWISQEQFHLSSAEIFTVFSSGVNESAKKDEKLSILKQFADSFRVATKDSNRLFPIIDVSEEARLCHVGMIPLARRYTSFLIDIGSGNTKGGFFPRANPTDFKLFELPWGTKRLCHAVENRLGEDATFFNFKKQLYAMATGTLDEEVAYAVNSSGGYDLNNQIVFSGGIVWALSNLMFPRLVENTVVPVSFSEMKDYCQKLAEDPKSCQTQSILQRYNEYSVNKLILENELIKIENVFDRRDLLAGAQLLLSIMRQFESVYATKEFYMIKKGHVGWISAYVDAQAEKNKTY